LAARRDGNVGRKRQVSLGESRLERERVTGTWRSDDDDDGRLTVPERDIRQHERHHPCDAPDLGTIPLEGTSRPVNQ
jgi:hypothetical protein